MAEHSSKARRRAALALALLVPAPTLGALAAFVISPGTSGPSIYLAAKVWIGLLPLVWLLRVDREPVSHSPLDRGDRRRGLTIGLLLGLAMGAVILGAWEAFGRDLLDVERLRQVERDAGLTTGTRYIAFSLYIILVNSMLEEYVWRWFVYGKCEVLVGRRAGVVLSALFFTLHHAVTFSVQMDTLPAALASLGVFVAGLCWSGCYSTFRSIWPGYVSHALADVAGLWIGWRILFGG